MASNFLPYIIPRTSATRHHYNLVTFAGIYLPPLTDLSIEVISAPFEVHATLTSDTLCSDIEITSSPFSLSPTVTLTSEVEISNIVIESSTFILKANLISNIELSNIIIESSAFNVKANLIAEFYENPILIIFANPFKVSTVELTADVHLSDFTIESESFVVKPNITAQFTRAINSVPFEVQATLTIKGTYLLDISNNFLIFWNAANVIETNINSEYSLQEILANGITSFYDLTAPVFKEITSNQGIQVQNEIQGLQSIQVENQTSSPFDLSILINKSTQAKFDIEEHTKLFTSVVSPYALTFSRQASYSLIVTANNWEVEYVWSDYANG